MSPGIDLIIRERNAMADLCRELQRQVDFLQIQAARLKQERDLARSTLEGMCEVFWGGVFGEDLVAEECV